MTWRKAHSILQPHQQSNSCTGCVAQQEQKSFWFFKWKASNEMLKKLLECWRFYDSQHKNAHISDRSPSQHKLKTSCLEKFKQKPTNCNYPKQMEKSQLQRRCSFVMRKEENVRKIYEKCFSIYFSFGFAVVFVSLGKTACWVLNWSVNSCSRMLNSNIVPLVCGFFLFSR